ncbi:hypothetical protein KUCAC02_016449, partial [Chaenocephalus aceratus]
SQVSMAFNSEERERPEHLLAARVERERPERLLTARVRETGASAHCEGQRERDRSVCSLRGSERERPERLLARLLAVRVRERDRNICSLRRSERETGASAHCEGQREKTGASPLCE